MSDWDLFLLIGASVFAGQAAHSLVVVAVVSIRRRFYMRATVKRLTAEWREDRKFYSQMGNIDDAWTGKGGLN